MRCKAYFAANSTSTFAFYGPSRGPQRRVYHGQEFDYDYDEDKNELVEVNGRNMIAFKTPDGVKVSSWMVSIEPPKKKPGPKKKAPKTEAVDEEATY